MQSTNDITTRKRIDEELRQADEQRVAQLKDADRQKDEFLAILGHELRNPLAAIVCAVNVLKTIDLPSTEAIEMREVIARQAKLMQQLMDDLLDVSRIARGKLQLHPERLNLNELVRQVVEDQRLASEDQKLLYIIEVPDDVIGCQADRGRLSQVLTNILHNAGKFTEPGGRITVQLKPDHEAGVAIISVADTGIGMDSETLARLFEPFTQADYSRNRIRGGLGLGLALAKGLVELHGGHINAQSAGPGQGSQFEIRIPITAQIDPAPHAIELPVREHPCRIMVVDDRRDAVFPLVKLLERDGHQVKVVGDGLAALQVAPQFQPHVVLCDIGLPGMDGHEVARRLRQERCCATTFLAAITGYGQDEDRRRAIEAGFNLHVKKPVSLDQLRRIVAEARKHYELLSLVPDSTVAQAPSDKRHVAGAGGT